MNRLLNWIVPAGVIRDAFRRREPLTMFEWRQLQDRLLMYAYNVNTYFKLRDR